MDSTDIMRELLIARSRGVNEYLTVAERIFITEQRELSSVVLKEAVIADLSKIVADYISAEHYPLSILPHNIRKKLGYKPVYATS